MTNSQHDNHPDQTDALIDYIVQRYNDTYRRELPELAKLAEKVERVHSDHPQAPIGLAATLTDMMRELELHLEKEETILFPMMKGVRHDPATADAIAHMLIEHDDHGDWLNELARITGGGALPADACGSWRRLYAGVGKLRDDLVEHIALENDVLFPQFTSETPRASRPAVKARSG